MRVTVMVADPPSSLTLTLSTENCKTPDNVSSPPTKAISKVSGALEGISSVACLPPVVLGAKTTSTVQLFVGVITWFEQLFEVMLNSAASVPVRLRVPMSMSKLPVLVIVNACAGDCEPTSTTSKA
ncbi:hypothetical protein THIOM_005432 [Candidatus Thiomargarita nelsonii]|uniref:Uncharacterized protein n=1 Tax=Candidatus Thiomargarita nelsonii TaxID=1003181 RepID=A0A176RTB1_9GAMM|nr:hypothetical protein THIOM_005432 [Candidatus Thiomargarita nelsonii]